MKKNTKERGDIFEDIACNYLEKAGYKVLLRNIYVGSDEIDIICREKKTGVLVFVEVKGGRKFVDFSPELHFGATKARRFSRACRMFAGRHPKLVKDCGYRLDLLVVELMEDLLTDWERGCNFRHYENVLA
jgi:putative endonuclease